MKFGKRLKQQIEETLPEWRDKFLSYKELKKLLRIMSTSPLGGVEADFVRLLVSEVGKFNAFFVEQEEDFVIRHKELQERIRDVIETVGPAGWRPSEAIYRVEMVGIRKAIVNLHGEMVLLENYSNVNYTGLAKILKKYDKRTGRLLRLPFIEKVLTQPFFTTDLVSSLVKDLENTLDDVFPVEDSDIEVAGAEDMMVDERVEERMKERAVAGLAEPGILRNTIAALTTMRELRRGSSTYGHFSLPPLDIQELDQQPSLQPSSPVPIQ